LPIEIVRGWVQVRHAVLGIPPFDFPSIAVACGNRFVLKPAEKAPLTGTRLVAGNDLST
jgi:acyl-CoA reductase-like NAD-dependent aldehyde dehydrogenase